MAISMLATRRGMTVGLIVLSMLAALVLQLADVNPAVSQTAVLTAYQADKDPGLDPNSSAWKQSVRARVPMTAQGASYPAGGGSIAMVTARALHYNGVLYVKVEWDDSTMDDSTGRVQDFSDAVALEFPAQSAATVPAVCMGQADAGVNIWHWRADYQAGVPDVFVAHPNALVDGYPSDEDLFFTARAAGNPMSQSGAVQDLIAQAFRTIDAAPSQEVQGLGVHENGKWSVVFARALAGVDSSRASFANGTKTDMAFAVWDGSKEERNGQKSVSTFVRLSVSGAAFPDKDRSNAPLFWAVGLLVGISAIAVGIGWYGYREGKAK